MQTKTKTRLRPEDRQHLANVEELIRRAIPADAGAHSHIAAALHMAEIRRLALRGDIDFDKWRETWRVCPDIPEDLKPAPLPTPA